MRRLVILMVSLGLAFAAIPGAVASAPSATSHRANVTILGPRPYTGMGYEGCVQAEADGHGTVERVLRGGEMYLRLSLNSNETVVSGEADYWAHKGLAYSRPWTGDADLPLHTTLTFEGKTRRVDLGQIQVHVYDPTVHVTGCNKTPTTTSDGPAPVALDRVGDVVPTSGPAAITLHWASPGGETDAGTYITRSGGPSGSTQRIAPDNQLEVPVATSQVTDANVTAGYTYVYTLYAHEADGVIGPADRIAVAALVPGEYTVKVTVDPALVKKVGGWSQVKTKIARQFAVINDTFNDPDEHLLLHYDFKVAEVTRFTGSCQAARDQPHPGYTFLLAEVDKCPESVFGARTDAAYWTDEQAVVIAHHIGTLKLKAFASDEGEILTHEFGHSRGAIDEYKVAVPKSRNSITGTSYIPPPSIMNNEYVTHVFDPYTQDVINTQGNALTLDQTEAVAARILPADVQVKVLVDGAPLTTPATVRLWASYWGSRTVWTSPAVTKVTDAEGVADMGANLFGSSTDHNTPWNIATPLWLATVDHQGHIASGWISIIEATTATYGQSDQSYQLTLNLTSGAQPTPTPST